MEWLREQNFRAIIGFLREAYVQPDVDTFAGWTVQALTRVVGAQRVSYNEMHPKVGTIRALIRPADHYPWLDARQYREHPLLQHLLTTGDGRAHKVSDFLSRTDFQATAMYQEYYRHVGVEHQMAIWVGMPSPHFVGFALGRDRLDFGERDRLALNLLRPHLVRAYSQASAAARMRSHMQLLGRAAEAAEAGVVLLSRDGRIEYSTRRARQWLREYFGRRGRPSTRLPEPIADWLRLQPASDAIRARLEVLPGPLTVARDGRRLTVRFVNAAPPALLLEERRDGPSPQALARLGLTGRESQVLALVARGASNESIGQALGATPRTVAKHVERIHRKLGVDNRTAAAARAHEIWAAPAD